MNTVYELIDQISLRTSMYVGEHKLSNIRSFIDGYTFSIESQIDKELFLSDFPGFHNWVAVQLGFKESTAGWQNMILAIEMGYNPKEVSWDGYADGATEEQHRASVSKFFKLVWQYQRA